MYSVKEIPFPFQFRGNFVMFDATKRNSTRLSPTQRSWSIRPLGVATQVGGCSPLDQSRPSFCIHDDSMPFADVMAPPSNDHQHHHD